MLRVGKNGLIMLGIFLVLVPIFTLAAYAIYPLIKARTPQQKLNRWSENPAVIDAEFHVINGTEHER